MEQDRDVSRKDKVSHNQSLEHFWNHVLLYVRGGSRWIYVIGVVLLPLDQRTTVTTTTVQRKLYNNQFWNTQITLCRLLHVDQQLYDGTLS